mmetsp:Transcript_14390/g.56607  ORF Transcript_14390/g.56607 Transcript_14390/m.56607 type:complete len:242 (-) Transcript_14390:514-1239(-)
MEEVGDVLEHVLVAEWELLHGLTEELADLGELDARLLVDDLVAHVKGEDGLWQSLQIGYQESCRTLRIREGEVHLRTVVVEAPLQRTHLAVVTCRAENLVLAQAPVEAIGHHHHDLRYRRALTLHQVLHCHSEDHGIPLCQDVLERPLPRLALGQVEALWREGIHLARQGRHREHLLGAILGSVQALQLAALDVEVLDVGEGDMVDDFCDHADVVEEHDLAQSLPVHLQLSLAHKFASLLP